MIKMPKRRRLGLWLGKPNEYLMTLLKCLRFIRQKKPTEINFREWIKQQFPSLKSKRVTKDKVRILQSLELVIIIEGSLFLSEEGEEFLRTTSKRLLFEQLDKNYLGFAEIIKLLSGNPSTLEEIKSFLETETGINWKTTDQPYIRMRWLQGINYVTRDGGYFILTEEAKGPRRGRAKETNGEKPSHSNIADQIVKLGQINGKISEQEYRVNNLKLDVVWKEIKAGKPSAVFEISLKGSLMEALTRLKSARYLFGRPELYLVTDSKHIEKAKESVRTSFSELADVIEVIH
jgi:hypothetical protein